jgi:hypothetical protein
MSPFLKDLQNLKIKKMNKELLFKLGLLLVVKIEQILKKSPKKLWILEYQQNIKRQENKYLKTT